jgi:hypothetical protein
MQPTYMPWAGYFNLIAQADVFVFLDDVQYEKSSWQSRNRILVDDKIHLITVPSKRLYLGQKIKDIQIDDNSNWRYKQFKLISQTYSQHPFVGDILSVIEIILDPSIIFLSDLNTKIINLLSLKLGLSTRFIFSSNLNIIGHRSERLVKICEYLNCDEYLSPLGSADYLTKDGNFQKSDVKLLFQEYIPAPYPQRKQSSFISHLSILDVIANLGWNQSLKYVQAEN